MGTACITSKHRKMKEQQTKEKDAFMKFEEPGLIMLGDNLFDPNKINYCSIKYPDDDKDIDQVTVCTIYFVGSRFPLEARGEQAIVLWDWLKNMYLIGSIPTHDQSVNKPFRVSEN